MTTLSIPRKKQIWWSTVTARKISEENNGTKGKKEKKQKKAITVRIWNINIR